MDFTAQQRGQIVRLYYLYKSPSCVLEVVKKEFPGCKKLSKRQLHRFVRKFEETGSLKDDRKENPGRPKASRSDENIVELKKIIEETPQKSIRKIHKASQMECSVSSVYRMLKFDLHLKPYKISIMQHLKPSDVTARLQFAEWMLKQETDVLKKMWFSDEAHFYLNAAINKQNCRFWGSEKPALFHERPLHGEYVTVWVAMSEIGTIGPYFFEDSDGHTASVNSDRYLKLLSGKFLPALLRKGVNLEDAWFQQDGATPHTATKIVEWLEENFKGRYLSYRTERIWPPHSPDLNPLDFFLWGYLKDHVYTEKPTTLHELKLGIKKSMRSIHSETYPAVIQNFRERLSLVQEQKGGHLEHII